MDKQDNVDVKDRLREFLAFKKISQLDYCNTIGVSQSYVSSMKQGMSQKILELTHKLYPELNMLWLIFGEGDMIMTERQGVREAHIQQLLDVIESQQRSISDLSLALRKTLE